MDEDSNEKKMVELENNGDMKHLSATFLNDQAIEIELLETQLRLDKAFPKRKVRDKAFIELAFKTLKQVVNDCKKDLSIKYPSYQDIIVYLEKNHEKDSS